MSLNLSAGRESRTEGAPDLRLPGDMDMIEALAAQLLEQDEDGVYLGDIRNARTHAQQIYDDEVRMRRDVSDGRQAQAATSAKRRAAQRAAVRGVDPESLPADEYGSVSGRTVREANRPLADQDAALTQEQHLADLQVRGLREGRRNWAAEQAYQLAQEHGLGVTPSSTGKTDLDYIREQMNQQGYLRTGRGERIPMGPAPTPESIQSRRRFDEWANETPGTERQATYDPQAYEQFREGEREAIRNRAEWEALTFGTGPDRSVAPIQQHNRAARRASEDRVAESQREVAIARLAQRAGISRDQARQMMDSGQAAAMAARGADAGDAPLTAAERRIESQKLRDMANTRQDALREADLAERKKALRDQRMLLAPGGRGVVNAINQLPGDWRNIAMLDRLTQGRVGGPTPLGVEAAQMGNALPVMRSAAAGMLQSMDPEAAAARDFARQMQLAQMPPDQKAQLSIQMGQPMGTGYSAAHVGGRFNYWINHSGWRPGNFREQNFRMEMEGLGYTPEQIDAFMDARLADRDEPPAAPPPAAPTGVAPPPPPGGPMMWPPAS